MMPGEPASFAGYAQAVVWSVLLVGAVLGAVAVALEGLARLRAFLHRGEL